MNEVDGVRLQFAVMIDASNVGGKGHQEVLASGAAHTERLWSAKDAYAREVEFAMNEIAPDLEWRGPRRGFAATAGGFIPLEDAIGLVITGGVLATGLAVAFNVWLTLARNVRDIWTAIGSRFRAEPHVSNGTAMLLALAEFGERTDAEPVSLAFVTPVGRHPHTEAGEDAMAVGLRGATNLWVVIVALDGAICGVSRFSLPGELPVAWFSSDDEEPSRHG